MDILTLHEVEKKASTYPDVLDCFNKLYSPYYYTNNKYVTGIPFGVINKAVPAQYYLNLADNEYYYLTHISISYYASGAIPITQDLSPLIRFTDTSTGLPLNASADNYVLSTADNFIPISGNYTPGSLNAVGNLHENLIYLEEFCYIFPPQSQVLIEVLSNSNYAGEGVVDVLFRGYALRKGKV